MRPPKRPVQHVDYYLHSTRTLIFLRSPWPTPLSAVQMYVPRCSFWISKIFRSVPWDTEPPLGRAALPWRRQESLGWGNPEALQKSATSSPRPTIKSRVESSDIAGGPEKSDRITRGKKWIKNGRLENYLLSYLWSFLEFSIGERHT